MPGIAASAAASRPEHGRVDVAEQVDLGGAEDAVVDEAELRPGEDRVHVRPGDRAVAVRRPPIVLRTNDEKSKET
jgi:hypothetical protein